MYVYILPNIDQLLYQCSINEGADPLFSLKI